MSIRPMSEHEFHDPSFGANCFGCSPRNIKGIQLRFFPEGDEVHARVNLSTDYESYPGLIHGGIVALILDEVMGRAALWRARGPVLTVGIRIRYAAIMSPDTPYLCRAEAVLAQDGQWKGSGVIEDGEGALIATGNATFVRIPPEQLEEQGRSLPELARVHASEPGAPGRTRSGDHSD